MLQNDINYDNLIAKYLDNELSDDEKKLLWNWVDQTDDNKKHFKQTARVWESSLITLQDKQIARNRAKQFIRQRQAKKRHITYLRIFAGAAAVAIIVVSLQIFAPGVFFGEKTKTLVAENAKTKIVLPDNSVVHLNAQSTIQYPAKFKRKRKVFLTGEAYFNIQKDEKRPFEVRTNNITVEVRGTTFVVTDREDNQMVETVLESGKIHLTVNKFGKKIVMQPNQQLIYDKATDKISLQNVNARNYTDWRNSSLTFENSTLREVFTQFQKWYNTYIECSNEKLLNTRVSFTIDTEPLDDILAILQHITHFTWTKTTDGKIVVE